MTGPVVDRHAGPSDLAGAVAAAFVDVVVRVQQAGREPQIVLTGGSIAKRVHASVPEAPDGDRVRWDRVGVWFGDERFVARDDPDRNALQARETMLDRLPFDPARIHEMPWAGGEYDDDVEAAAAAHRTLLEEAAPPEGPWFDLLMLGIGPDGHCASLFPGRAEVSEQASVLAVRESPKPPPVRISLGMPALNRAREVWFVASGADKAEAVAAALAGSDPVVVPAAGPKGLDRTVWFLDRDAARLLPSRA